MILSDSTDKQGLVQDAYSRLGNSVDANAYKTVDVIRNINNRQHDVWFAIWMAHHGWTFIPNGNDPYTAFSVVSGTSDIDIGIASLAVRYVEIQNAGGSWERLIPMTEEEFVDLGGLSLQQDSAGAITGTVSKYVLRGTTLVLVQTPNYSQASGLRVHLDAAMTDFAISGDESESPSFASPFHKALSIGAALDYAESHNMKQTNSLRKQWIDLVGDPISKVRGQIASFYAKRFVDHEPKRIAPGRGLVEEYS